MTKICKNCNHICTGNFCSNCGQSTLVKRIDFRFVLHDLQHGLLHFDNGLFTTIKELLLNPGTTIQNFINGKWMNYFHPLSMLLILTAIYGLFDINNIIEKSNQDEFFSTFSNIFNWFLNHRNLLVILTLPLTTLGTKLIFRKEKYNYYEFLVLESYNLSLITFINILLLPITLYFSENSIISLVIFFFLQFISIRTKVLFFSHIKVSMVVFNSILVSILNIILITTLFLILSFISLQLFKLL